MRRSPVIIVTLMLLVCLMPACSLKKNTAATRQYTAFITRYNIYFNGDEHYKKTLSDMERNYEDDYTRTTLFMHPAEAYSDEKAPKPSGDFKRSIEKAQKAIQLRSIKKRPRRKGGKSTPESKKWLKREEYNPFLHNAWMMMGRSQYMNGDFLGAASTFFYISKHFWWLAATVTEAELWQARSYIASDWLFEAETILNAIKEKELTNSRLTNLYNFDMADLCVRSRRYDDAIPYLSKAADASKGSQKARLTFLLGQLYELTGKKAEAYAAYRKVSGMSSMPYRTRFNARIRQSEVFQGTDVSREVKSLRSLARYGANSQYLDQIYYAIGNLYLSRGDTARAIENYRTAVAKSTRNGIETALARLALGRLYYAQGDYAKAQPCYSAALPQLPDNYPDYRELKQRSDVLDELAVYSTNVTVQDSLLRLAAMSPEERSKVIDRVISELQKREKQEAENARREEYLAQQEAAGTGLNRSGTNAPSTFMSNADKSWYFYNSAVRDAGRTEFQKRWGARKLEDDWRRRNKNTFSSFEDGEEAGVPDNNIADTDTDTDEASGQHATQEQQKRASDPHFPEYYLRQIPSTPAEIANANNIIQEGLYNMGIILKDKMQDYPAAEHEFETLNSRYPDNIYRLETYYNLYLMFMLSDKPGRAEEYRRMILADFPETAYGKGLADPQYLDKLRRMPEEEARLYDSAYRAYMANDNARLRDIYQTVRRDYPMSRIMPKFMFLEALSYVTDNDAKKFSDVLSELAREYPESDVAPLASSYLSLLAEGRKLNSGAGNTRGMVWSTRLTNDTSQVSLAGQPAKFDLRADTAQAVLLIYNAADVDANRLLFDVARHNFSTYSVRDFDLEQLRFGSLGIIAVTGFSNRREADTYRAGLEKSGVFALPAGVLPMPISRGDFDLLLNEGRSLDEYFDAVGDERLRRVHESVLPSGEYDEPVIPAEAPAMPAASEAEQLEQAIEHTLPDAMEPAPGNHHQPSPVPAPKTKPQSRQKTVPPPKPKPKPTVPEVPQGSEGDDPLLD